MNTRKLILVAAAIVGAGAALAQSPQPLTRAEVRAEAIAANQAGQIQVGETAVLRDQLSTATSQRSRAEVQAEAAAANQARAGTVAYGDSPMLDKLRSTSSTLSRAQVRAEAIEAQRLGLMGYGERDQPRLPTPAELESIRQAGLRAIGMENVAKR
jgi:septum formation inhibitor MinC